MTLEQYIEAFSRLRRAPGSFPETTKKQAPHKPLLLLAVMGMVERKSITTEFISIDGELTELASLFTAYWRRVMPVEQVSSIAFPFSRLRNEPSGFWKLDPLPGKTIHDVVNVSSLRGMTMGARMDPELFAFMKNKQAKSQLTECLLISHFSTEGQTALREEMGIQYSAFAYSTILLKAKQPDAQNDYSIAARDQGFRRAIVNCYDHRCAMCGTRIVTADGYTAVEAAHIKPWSKFKNDEITNGMALCRLCHWAFDGGVMSVDDDYAVMASRQLITRPNAPGYLMTLAGREIIRPSDQKLWPARENLAWHRNEVFDRG